MKNNRYRYRVYTDLKNKIEKENINANSILSSFSLAVETALSSNSNSDIKLLMKLTERLFKKVTSKDLSAHVDSSYETLNNIKASFYMDPSQFDVVYFYAVFLYISGDIKRAKHLFIRLYRSGWSQKRYVSIFIDQSLLNTMGKK